MRTLLAILAAWLLAFAPAAAQLTTLGAGPGGAAGGGGGGLTFVSNDSFVAAASSGTHPISGTLANGDLIIVSTVNNGGGAAFTLSNGSTPLTVPQLNSTQSDGALQYEVFSVAMGSAEASTASINYSGMTTGGDINIAVYRGGATPSVDATATQGWNTAAAGPTLTWGGTSTSGSPVGFVIAMTGYSYNVANTLSCGPATWSMDVQNATPDSFFGNYYAHSANYTSTTTTCTGYGSQVKGGWLIRIDP